MNRFDSNRIRRHFGADIARAMSSAAVKAGRARLEAFRAARARGRREDDARATVTREDDYEKVDDGARVPAVETTEPSTTRAVASSENAREMTIDGDARARAEDAPREATTTARGGWDAGRDGDGDAAEATPATLDAPSTSAFSASAGASGGYFALADAYVDATTTTTAETRVKEHETVEDDDDAERGEEKSVLSATTSTDRAREQYERVMRAISRNDVIDSSLFDDPRLDGGRRADEEKKKEEEEEAGERPLVERSDLDAIIERVRTDGAIGAPATVVRDDQSEIVMLQEVIDELTTEKLGLVRGLQKSQLTVDELASENNALTQRYNETKSQLSHARSELDRLWMQYQAKCGDGDGLMMSNPDASERVQALAAEVVNLEERLHEFAETKEANERLRLEAKRSSARASEAELVLEATREQLRLFQERIRDSELMKTLDALEEDDAVLLCAWLRQSEAEAEREAKEDASSAEKKTRDDVDVTNDVDDEQIELLASINELLGQLENDKKSLARQLGSANEAKQQLAERNELLESQLAKALDRLALVDENWSEEEEVVKPRRGLLSFFRR